MSYKKILILISTLLIFTSHLFAEEFLNPAGQQKQVSVQNDKAKYFTIKPGQELSFKVNGPNSIKIYGRVINPAKSGNASFMVYQGSTLIGAMLVTPKPSQDFADGDKNMPLSVTSVQEFSISEGEQTVKIKSSAKSPDALVSVEVMKSVEQSIDLIPLVPLAPLVPQKKEEKAPELDLVPLVPLSSEVPKVSKQDAKPQPVTEKPKKEEKEKYKEIVAQSSTDIKKKESSPGVTTVVETTEKVVIEKRNVQLGVDLGMIIPFQSIGGPYLNADIQAIYFPIKPNPAFGVGLKVGYHNLNVDIKDGSGKRVYDMTSSLMPINLLLMYSIPVSKLIVTDLFAGGGVSLVSANLNSNTNTNSKSGSSVAASFSAGGAISFKLLNHHGLSLKLGYMGGKTSLDFVKDLEIGGLYITSGYNYTF